MNEIPQVEYDRLAELISSPDSPVGIDATKTHVMILHKLMEIEKKLDALSKPRSAYGEGR